MVCSTMDEGIYGGLKMETGIKFCLWFKNGTYIEHTTKKEDLSNLVEYDTYQKDLLRTMELIKEAFRKNENAQVSIDGLIIKVSELLAFEIKESEE